jgi:ribosomal protein S27AE
MKYADKLKDPRWQKKRLEIFNRDRFACVRCGDDKSMLSVHHFRYIPGREPWEYCDDMLTTLCPECHAIETDTRKDFEHDLLAMLSDKGFFSDDLYVLARGFLNSPQKGSDITASIIEFFLSNSEAFNTVENLYFKSLAERRENGKGPDASK